MKENETGTLIPAKDLSAIATLLRKAICKTNLYEKNACLIALATYLSVDVDHLRELAYDPAKL